VGHGFGKGLPAAFGAIVLLAWAASGALAQAPEEELPAALREEIRKLGPTARVLGEADLDHQHCTARPSPGLVVDDFNGNGRKDHAGLVLTGVTRKPPQPGPRAPAL
jgi:hypothetical protein